MFVFYLLFYGSNWNPSQAYQLVKFKGLNFFFFFFLGAFKSFSIFMDWIFVERMKVQPRLCFFHYFSLLYIIYLIYFRLWRTSERPFKFKGWDTFSKSHFVDLMNPKGAHYHYHQLACKKQKKKTQPKNSWGIEDGTLCATYRPTHCARMATFVMQFHINPKPKP
jgi:hypothetical protein